MQDKLFSLTPAHEIIERHLASVNIALLPEPAIHVQSFHKHPWKRGAEEIVKTYGHQPADSLSKSHNSQRSQQIWKLLVAGDVALATLPYTILAFWLTLKQWPADVNNIKTFLMERVRQVGAVIRELKQPRRQHQGKRHFKNDFQIF